MDCILKVAEYSSLFYLCFLGWVYSKNELHGINLGACASKLGFFSVALEDPCLLTSKQPRKEYRRDVVAKWGAGADKWASGFKPPENLLWVWLISRGENKTTTSHAIIVLRRTAMTHPWFTPNQPPPLLLKQPATALEQHGRTKNTIYSDNNQIIHDPEDKFITQSKPRTETVRFWGSESHE